MRSYVFDKIKDDLRMTLKEKINKYKIQENYIPFHTALLGKKNVSLFLFIHYLNINFEEIVYLPIAKELALASGKFKKAKIYHLMNLEIDKGIYFEANNIFSRLKSGFFDPDRDNEFIQLIDAISNEKIIRKPLIVDLYLEDYNSNIYLFDIKKARHTKEEIEGFKRKLLELTANQITANLSNGTFPVIDTKLVIPYNPYSPNPYSTWEMKGMLDIKKEVMIGQEFWDFLGGVDCYSEVLKCIEEIGIEIRSEIDNLFREIY